MTSQANRADPIFGSMVRALIMPCLFITWMDLSGQQNPEMRTDDKLRIKEAIDIATLYGDSLWAGFNAVPFTLLLVTDSVEYLVHHPRPSSDFRSIGTDPILGTGVYYRPRVYPPHLLATFPAVEGQSTIVVGTLENTGKTNAEWILTLLHEHFHQYQSAAPDHYARVDSLDLSGGDQTGMWMLNYPFPYTDQQVLAVYAVYIDALVQALDGDPSSLQRYRDARQLFKVSLSEKDYAYFSFQLWQEGLARYTEYKFADMVKSRPLPPALAAQGDTYAAVLKALTTSATDLATCDLADGQRICFYEVGLAEGLLMDRVSPAWREHYLRKKFFVEQYMTQ